MNIKPIMTGMFNNIAVNNRLRLICEYVSELETRVQALEGTKTHAPIPEVTLEVEVPKDEAQSIVETETASAESDTVFNFETCEDAPSLKAYAFSEHGLTITGNKKAETIRKEIQAHLRG